MLATSSHPVRTALAAAAMSVTALLTAADLGHAQELLADSSRGPRLALEKQPSLLPDQPAPYGRDHVFTMDECRLIRTATLAVFSRVGPENLSDEFRRAWINDFMMPDGRTSTCTGPRTIAWRTNRDKATFANIAILLQTPVTGLETPVPRVFLLRAGVDLAPIAVGSLSLR
jgi:hypothetical protein